VLARIIEASIRQPLLVGLGIAGLIGWGSFALSRIPVDALPDLSDVQVIVYADYPGQSPQVVEDQVTYPLSTSMLGVPFARTVRGYSFFGLSFVYVIFDEGTDLYWARSRVLEVLSSTADRLPAGVSPALGPDATGVGWVYQYALVDRTGRRDLAELRSLQDWLLRYELQAVPGVSEVASIGGHVREYQIEVDPNALSAFGIPLSQVRQAIRRSNVEVGGRLIEMAERELIVRGRGFVQSTADLEQIAIGADARGTPILLRSVAAVRLGPELRRGLTDLDGEGEVVAGIVVMRFGENALATIERVRARLERVAASLPEGVEIVTVYDRAPLIERAVDTLRLTLLQQCLIVAAICFLFLFHLRSALVTICLLPLGILFAFIVMFHQGVNADIMSLGGIAIAIGTMIDAGIVMVENAHRHLERDGGRRPRREVLVEAAVEVGPSLFFSLLIITASFLPIFALQAQEGRLFRPLAYTKTYAMFGAAVLSLTAVPALMVLLVRGRILPEARNPLQRAVLRVYRPALRSALAHPRIVLGVALVALASTAWPASRLGTEFMPPLDEGDLMYMPTTLPGISITKARELLQQTDRLIAQVPEVDQVFGKIGRADTATDPAPLSMIETTIRLKPPSEWRPGLTRRELVAELDRIVRLPGVTNAWTMPIRARIDMLSTGIKTPVGIRISGPDLEVLDALAGRIEGVVREVPGATSVYGERVMGGTYLDIDVDRERIARFGLSVADVQDVIATAIGGATAGYTVEGLERYPITLRYPRELRDDPEALGRVLVAAPSGVEIPLSQLATIAIHRGPPVVKSEDARPSAWVLVDIEEGDVTGFVDRARHAIEREVEVPAGYVLHFGGRYEYVARATSRLKQIGPIALGVIVLLLYLCFWRARDVALVMASLPFGVVGGIWLLYGLDYSLSVAVAAGILALIGLTAETGVIMLVFLNQATESALDAADAQASRSRLADAIVEGASSRARPLLMTVASDAIGLLPIMWATGTGSQTMQRIAAPLIGGILSATLVILFVLPVLYAAVVGRRLPAGSARQPEDAAAPAAATAPQRRA
jgi:Cu(I)/Ag(I) efflux system membrane protein CusA/SilA